MVQTATAEPVAQPQSAALDAPPASVEYILQHRYLRSLDGWRALAILLVVVGHSSDSVRAFFDPSTSQITPNLAERTGLLGVRIFFAISGFLITTRLLDEERISGHVDLRGFYTRRFFRILPPAFFFLLVVGSLGLAKLVPVRPGHWLSALLCYANLTHADRTWYIGHYWSLAVEEQFYLVWPALMLLVGARARPQTLLALIVTLTLWRAADYRFDITHSPGQIFWGRTDVYADCLLWGCLAAVLYSRDAVRAFLTRLLKGWLWVLVAALALFTGIYKPQGWKPTFLFFSISAFLIPFMLTGTLVRSDWWTRALNTRLMTSVGRLSYSVYLWQQLFLVFFGWRAPRMHFLQAFPQNIAVTFGAAALSYFFVEKPMIALGRRLSS